MPVGGLRYVRNVGTKWDVPLFGHPNTAIFIPTLSRPHKIASLVSNIHATTPLPHNIYFTTSDPDTMLILTALRETYFDDSGFGNQRYGERMNLMFRNTIEPYVVLAADDVVFHDGWLEAAFETMGDMVGVVSFRDGFNPRGTCCLIDRRYIEDYGGYVGGEGVVIYEGYGHFFTETELYLVAMDRGKWRYSENSYVEHMHYVVKDGKGGYKGVPDACYRRAEAWARVDEELYMERNNGRYV